VSGLLGVQFLGSRIVDVGGFVVAAVRNAAAVIVSVSVLGVAAGVIYAAREVPADAPRDTPNEAGSRRAAPRAVVPVPIPMHAFDPPPPRGHEASSS